MAKDSQILSMNPVELALWLEENYTYETPINIDSIDEMKEAGRMLSKISNSYAYIATLASLAKVMIPVKKKKGKENKENSEDMIDRRDLLQNKADVLKLQYQTISRMITVKQEINAEMKMM